MDNVDKAKIGAEFIKLGTKWIEEILVEEYPDKHFKIDGVSIKSDNTYHFLIDDPTGDERIKIVLTWEDFKDKSKDELKQKAREHISDFYSAPDFFGDSD